MSSILYLSVIENPINNGIISSQVLNLLSTNQANNKHKFFFFTAPSGKLISRTPQTERKAFLAQLKAKRIDVLLLPIPFLSNHFIKIAYTPIFVLYILPKLILTILLKKIEVIHCRSYPASLAGLIAAILMRKKHIFDMRGSYPEEAEFLFPSWQRRSLNFKGWKILERWMLTRSDHVVVVSEKFKEFIISEYVHLKESLVKKISVIPCGVEINRVSDFQNKTIKDQIILAYSGTLDGWTTPHLLSQTFKKLISANTRDLFLNVYTSTDNIAIKNAFEAEGIPSDKYCIQALKPGEVKERLSQNHFGLLIRVPSIVNEVSFPVKFGEYLECGLPVITNEVTKGINGFILEHNVGLIIEKANYKLDALVKDYDFYTDNCLKAAKIISNEKIADQYSLVYSKMTRHAK